MTAPEVSPATMRRWNSADLWMDARHMHIFDPQTGENLTHGNGTVH